MSDDEISEVHGRNEEGKKRLKSHSRVDVMLFLLVHFVDRGELNDEGRGAAIGVTLTTTGGVISGVMIGRAEWLRSLTATARSGSEWLGTFVESAIDELNLGDDDPITHVHLKDVRFVAGDSMTGPVSETRVRLDDVVSWSLGAFSRADA